MKRIGKLPHSLCVAGKDYDIRTDYRDCLLIMQAFNDPELSDDEKYIVTLEIMYKDFESINPEQYKEAYEKSIWFLDCGREQAEEKPKKQLMDWEHDEDVIFPAINNIAKCEVREKEYLHWWTFIGYYMEIGKCLFTNIINIRWKKANSKKLDKAEQEFYRSNKSLIDLPKKMTSAEMEEYERLNNLCN